MNKKNLVKKTSLILIICIFLLSFQVTAAFATRKVLPVPQYSQQPYDQICWATSAAMIISFFKNDTTNRNVQIAKDKFGTDFNQPASLSDQNNAVKKYAGVTSGSIQNNALSYTAVQYQINNNGPIGTAIYWSSGGGHAEVIKGYDTSLDNEVLYNDPWDGQGHGASYSYYTNNSTWTWGGSLFFK